MLFPPQPRAKYCKNEGAGGGLPKEEEVDPLSINAAVVERVYSFKFLATIISSSLKWEDNITAIIKRAHQRLFFSSAN